MLDELFDRSGKADKKELIIASLENISKSDNKTAIKIAVYKKYYVGEECSAAIDEFIKQYGIVEDVYHVQSKI